MNKHFKVLLLGFLFTGAANAQSNTYEIEKLSKPEKLLPLVSPDKLFEKIDKNFVKLSVTGQVVDLGTRPVITGYLRAYQNHYPITISPDIAWLLICQGFSHHLNSNPEALKPMLVKFKDKKQLTVIRYMSGTAGLEVFPWESVFPEFVQQISTHTGKELINHLSADFTTTTPTSLIAGQITIMESMKEFFNYKVIMIGCGIPKVTIEGSLEDWEKIIKRLDYLARYDLEWWTSELKPVIRKIIDTKKGKVDKDFWMNMVKYHKTGLYGTYDGIDGWFLKFYPYLEGVAAPKVQAANHPEPLSSTQIDKSGNLPGLVTVGFGTQTRDRVVAFTRSSFKEIKNVGDLPKEISSVPFLFEIKNGSGEITSSNKMEFWAGFMGVNQNQTTFNIKPEIGWAVNMPK